MGLRIDQQFGLIGLYIKQPSFRLDIRPPELELEIRPPQLEIDQELPRVEIDQRQCFADAGRKSQAELSREMAETSRRKTLEWIGKTAKEGDLLGAIEKGVDVADIALMNSQAHYDEYDVAAIPRHRPLVDLAGGLLDINLQPGKVVTGAANGQVDGRLDWGRVWVFWQQRPMIDIEYTGRRVDVSA